MATARVEASELRQRARELENGCTSCGECLRDCPFLQRYGLPRAIAARLGSEENALVAAAFRCDLCGLCNRVCPEELDVGGFFLELRRRGVELGVGNFPEHRPLLSYEKIGTSRRFTLCRLPEGCTTVFFPGCSLSGTRPEAVTRLFLLLRFEDPKVGIVLDCCMKPSYSLGRTSHAESMFRETEGWLAEHGVQEVIVACPNCQTMFETLGERLRVRTVWEILAESRELLPAATGTVTIHDPCSIRDSGNVHRAVRKLLDRQGLTVEEMPHAGRTTLCCGLGGGVKLLEPDLAREAGTRRREEAAGRRIVSYCGGCVEALSPHTPTSHLTDLLFEPGTTLAGRKRGAKAPFTYVNRLLLKRTFVKMGGFAVTRERTVPEADGADKSRCKRLVFPLLLAAAVVGARVSGATDYLQQERLEELITGFGIWAPAVYILIYSLAPVLFLPGLPITIVGGVLFGPFWGVVYTITGATVGASLAFLVARYGARDWVAAKLTGPKWEKLDNEVAQHGWKVVAFTRLIPAFPFNLLNYAFGLTKIPFIHYAVTSFVCMLPACIAFIVFSSSLLGLIRGKISATAVVGIGLVILVSLIPTLYRKVKGRQQPVAE